ncbi:MAG: stage 0 sporulation family protein [Clostridia bacterium]|nr:stage 0 sporulation family protein [Clostridia bacterium]
MKNIIGVRFRRLGKIYFFNPQYLVVRKGEYVIVETSDGEEIAEVMIPNRKISEEKIVAPLKKVIRIANPKDMKHFEDCKKKEKEAFEYCTKKIKEHKLKMNLTDVECKFDNTKLLFFFTADGRIDFRDLVKDLANNYKTRIELRQIGVRDEIKRIGGNGICGRELCCCSFLSNFETVSIKMAKEQNLSLNPTKISGNCGRLMCCLKYEDEVYTEKAKRLPHVGAIVRTEEGTGVVEVVETLAERVKVKIRKGDAYTYKKYDVKDITVIEDVIDESENEEEKQHSRELAELEKLEQLEKVESKGGENYGI